MMTANDKTTIAQRLKALRQLMEREHLGAFLFPSTDPHGSEYVADHWKGREWISGFNGSAGTAVVTMKHAALWTDSRYFIAAAEQLADTEFQLMKMNVDGTPTIAEWLENELIRPADRQSTEVAVDGTCIACATAEDLVRELRQHGGMTLRTNLDPLQTIWTDRPPLPQAKIAIQPLTYAGKSCQEKLAEIRQQLRKQHADGMLVCRLDDIAWTLNLRGSDIHCNPVFIAFLLIDSQKATLFVDPGKLGSDVSDYLRQNNIATDRYENVAKGLADYFEYNILMDPAEVNSHLYKATKRDIVRATSPIPALKAIKNESEVRGFNEAMLSDGIAMTQFLRWLSTAVKEGGQTELTVSEKLLQLRSRQHGFQYCSFDTIAAYAEHAAIVHYEPTPDTDIPLRPEGFLLLDSGGQYLGGTTDITRTIPLGPLTREQRLVYTLVLKGHIQLQLTRFPDGACGTQLDAIARKDMWGYGYNYLHGTGHGVGAYLNVHEGPHQIRMNNVPAPLHAGMTVTDEPGIYLEGRFGVRIENTLLICHDRQTEFGSFLKFESLTLCPIDTEPIITGMMLPEELAWLNNYHRQVFQTLSPHLAADDRNWLAAACREI